MTEDEAMMFVTRALERAPDIERWFHPETMKEIGRIQAAIDREPDDRRRLLLSVCLSDILRACSGQGRGWGYISDGVWPSPIIPRKHALVRFAHKTSSIARAIDSLEAPDFAAPKPVVKRGDARMLDTELAPESVDLIVTSPPYPGTADYTRVMRFSYYWLGGEFDADSHTEIGARWKNTRKAFHREYLDDIARCIWAMRTILKPKAHLGLVLPGPSSRFGHITQRIAACCEDVRFRLVYQARRNVRIIRRNVWFERTPGVPDEMVLVFRRE